MSYRIKTPLAVCDLARFLLHFTCCQVSLCTGIYMYCVKRSYVLCGMCRLYFSVAVPFKGEYVKLSNNKRWKKATNNAPVIWADWVQKINRKNGKVALNLCNFQNVVRRIQSIGRINY